MEGVKENVGKVKSCSRIKDRNRRLALEDDEVQRIWKDYFQDLYNINTQEQVAVQMFGFDGVDRGNYLGQLIRGTDTEI